MPANVVTEADRWVTNPDGSKRRRNASDLPRARRAAAADLPPAVDPDKDATSYATPRTHKDADKQARARGLVFPDDVRTVKAKAAFLASA